MGENAGHGVQGQRKPTKQELKNAFQTIIDYKGAQYGELVARISFQGGKLKRADVTETETILPDK